MKKIIHANNIEYLRTLKDNSVDSVATDPPYGINFMNKKWDYDVPSVELWQEVFRVLKPGGHMLVACGTRTQHRMAVNIEDAGFEIRDIVAWVYGSGFPKSLNVGLAIDKMNGHPNRGHRIAVASRHQPDGTFLPNGENLDAYEPKTNQAKQWNGWGTALKPSMELWTLARKPLKGTVAQNILEYGVGGINIDGCRIGSEKVEQGRFGRAVAKSISYHNGLNPTETKETVEGRFPANFIHDGSEEVEKLFPETAPSSSGGISSGRNFGQDYDDKKEKMLQRTGHDDNGGSASRFFYVAKASQEERNFGLYDFEEQQVGSLSGGNREGKIDDVSSRFRTIKKNIHPTVKPIELMRYLVRMITPPNGICLDPYLGSGTTAIACEMEKFNYIGIERDEQYIEIAKARVEAVKDYESSLDTKTIIKESIKEDKEKELGIQNIFDLIGE